MGHGLNEPAVTPQGGCDQPAELIKRNVDRYLKDEVGGRQRGLERLRQAIHNEETERRESEDWSWRMIMFARCRT